MERREASILFAHVRNFAATAEALEPEQVLEILNHHFRVVTEAIRRHQGTLMEYVGDMVMGAFDVPNHQPGHPRRAAEAALEVRRSLERFAAERKTAGLPVLRFGMGLSTGPVIAGCQGTEYRYEYSALGDPTNVAFHISSQAKAGQILISEELRNRLDERAKVRSLGTVRFNRRRERMPVRELVELAE